jgi:hypothetical protein
MMVGADRIYLCPDDHNDQIMANSAPHLIWQQFKPPHNYITSNWPIKVRGKMRIYKLNKLSQQKMWFSILGWSST